MACELHFSDGQVRPMKLKSLGGAPKSRLLFFEGIASPEQARDLWGAVIEVRRRTCRPCPEK